MESDKKESILRQVDDQDLLDFEAYLVKVRQYSEKTSVSYAYDIARFLLFLRQAKVPKDKVDKETIRTYLLTLNVEEKARTTIRRHVASLRHFYHYLYKYKGYEENPFETTATPKGKRKLPRFLSHEEINDFLNLDGKRTDRLAKRDQAILELMFASGLRAAETIGLKTADVHLDERYVHVFGKGSKERDVPFSQKAKEALQDYLVSTRPLLLDGKEKDDGTLFLSQRGHKLSERGLESLVEKAAKKAGFTLKVHPHMLRHTFATELLGNGADLRVIQELMGHSSINTTSIYTHVTYDDLRQTYERCFPDREKEEEERMEKAVIFDFNGTMFFDEDKHVTSWKVFAKERFGFDLQDSDFIDHVHGHSNYEILFYIAKKTFTGAEVLELAREKETFYQRLCEEDEGNLHLVDGLTSLLDTLKKDHIRLAIATASMKPNVDWYIKTFDLHRWFDDRAIVYDDGTLTKGKPDPMIYNRAIERLGVRKEDCVVFEDALSGALSAKRAGVGLLIEVDDPKRKDKPDLANIVDGVIPDFKALPEKVLSFLHVDYPRRG